VNEESSEQKQGEGAAPSQEEVRAQIDEQIRKLRVQDLMVESVVSVLNLTARRLAKEDERDLEQARVGIEAVRAWVDLLPEDAANQIRNALSELQMLYAQAIEQTGGEQGGHHPGAAGREAKAPDSVSGDEPPSEAAEKPSSQRPRAADRPPRLWTPPGSNG
jgi:hypothetical protein